MFEAALNPECGLHLVVSVAMLLFVQVRLGTPRRCCLHELRRKRKRLAGASCGPNMRRKQPTVRSAHRGW